MGEAGAGGLQRVSGPGTGMKRGEAGLEVSTGGDLL